jgi:hypothetical protein
MSDDCTVSMRIFDTHFFVESFLLRSSLSERTL